MTSMTFLSIKFSQPVKTIIQREEPRITDRVTLQNERLRNIFLDKDAADEAPITLTLVSASHWSGRALTSTRCSSPAGVGAIVHR